MGSWAKGLGIGLRGLESSIQELGNTGLRVEALNPKPVEGQGRGYRIAPTVTYWFLTGRRRSEYRNYYKAYV